MFTGLVEEVGEVTAVSHGERRSRLAVACATVTADAGLGASIAVDGCCLTISDFTEDGFAADLMAETLRATALGQLEAGSPVNLERAMAAGERFGGHLVQGHVDEIGEVVDRQEEPGTTWLTIAASPQLAPYLAPKGSVAVQGVSLTVVDVHDRPEGTRFRVALIPHTCEVTTLGQLAVEDPVNLEADIVAKYLERLVRGDRSPAPTPYPRGTDA